jgi:tRNA splicing endonuclease
MELEKKEELLEKVFINSEKGNNLLNVVNTNYLIGLNHLNMELNTLYKVQMEEFLNTEEIVFEDFIQEHYKDDDIIKNYMRIFIDVLYKKG